MPGPGKYAKAVPLLRVMKASLLTRETIRELSLSPSLDEASTLLRDTPYSDITSATQPSSVQAIALKTFFARMQKALRVLPKEAATIINAFLKEEEARDILAAMRSIAEGKHLPLLPTASIPGTIPFQIRREPELAVSLQRLVEFLSKTWFKKYAFHAQRLAAETRSIEVYTWMAPTIGLVELSAALNTLKGLERKKVERIICPYLSYKIVASLVNAKALRIPVRILDRILGDLRGCGVTWEPLRGVYEREPGPQEVLSYLREVFPNLELDPKLPYNEALEQARLRALKESGRRAWGVYAGYPFTPALAAAAAMLAKIEMLDVTTVITGIMLKLPPDEIQEMLISL